MKYLNPDRCLEEINGARYVVVGSGFFGSVIAERIANDLKEKVVVIEKRNHVGGNSHSQIDSATGIECHSYGSHIFHTSKEKVWRYINRFCSFNNYRHRVLTKYEGKVYQMPINLATINSSYGLTMSPSEARLFLQQEIEKEHIKDPLNLEEKAISQIGRLLYERFIKGYTHKQWETDPKKLPANIISRLPVRYNYDPDYFDDPWQGIPVEGYHNIFRNMLNNPNISVYLNTDYFSIRHKVPKDCHIVYTGPVDRFFDYKYGELKWRTLKFEKEIINVDDYQGTSVMNYADVSVPHTRIHEFKHYHRERNYPIDSTVIFREYSAASTVADEPYYPINTDEDRNLFQVYATECKKYENILFGGRLGTYRYLDMDQSIAEALELYEHKIKIN